MASFSSSSSDETDSDWAPHSPPLEDFLQRYYHLHYDHDAPPDSEGQAKALASLHIHMDYIKDKWGKSPKREMLVEAVKKKILPAGRVEIENALCLGIGSFEKVEFAEYYGSEISGDKGEFWANNFSFIQLLVFETVLDVLRKRCNIKSVAFQDPEFTPADKAFLEGRGHIVIPYPASEMAKATLELGRALDPNIVRQYSSKSFLFTPYLEVHILARAVHALKPNLYLGIDLFKIATHPRLADPDHPCNPLVKELDAFAWSRDFEHVPALCPDPADINISLHWPRDPKDESVLERVKAHWREGGDEREKFRKQLAAHEVWTEERMKNPEEAVKIMEEKMEVLRLQEKFQAVWKERVEKEKKQKKG